MLCKPKKGLGQNFLVDKNIQRKIISACEFTTRDTVLEIGAGRGDLTRMIAPQVGRIFALEIDSCLCRILEENLKEAKNLTVINTDILKFDLGKYFRKHARNIKAVGNIPYYISSPIIEHLFKFRGAIDTVFLTVQKEFARRMVSQPGSKEYGSFSCFVQYHSEAKILFTIRNNSFFPAPKVNSCFVRLSLKRNLPLNRESEELLFKVIRRAFNERRKTLRNSLKDLVTQKKLSEFFERYNILPNTRPEMLSLNDFINLASLSRKN